MGLFGGGGKSSSNTTVTNTQVTYGQQGAGGIQGGSNRVASDNISGTSKADGSTVSGHFLGTGATYVESLDGDVALSAIDSNKDLALRVVSDASDNNAKLIDALSDSTRQSQTFSAGIVDEFKSLAEGSQVLLRDSLATLTNSDTLAKQADTSATRKDKLMTAGLVLGAGLLGLWLWKRSR